MGRKAGTIALPYLKGHMGGNTIALFPEGVLPETSLRYSGHHGRLSTPKTPPGGTISLSEKTVPPDHASSFREATQVKTNEAEIGILCWEAGQVEQGLLQLETLVGNSTNPASFAFPTRLYRVKGANMSTILENPSRVVLKRMIAAAREMAADGVRAVTTSCGFNAIFQEEIANAVDIPVFTSSLLQVPFVQRIVGRNKEVAIITAKAASLKPEHLRAVGIVRTDNLHIHGLENCPEWGKMFSDPQAELNLDIVRQEVVGTAVTVLRAHPRTGAFVLECTDLPPFAAEIRVATGLPVFDFVTMVNAVHASL